ncbi:MAG: LmeA family phospholipid-binding protein, partial [Synergistaceae bacterium]|nr:LmeA family phospholipid-binding protein [Synergistaceae bacterium]
MMKKFLMALIICLIPLAASADEIEDLLNFYVKKFTPEQATLIISDKPDATGLFSEVYLDLKGVVIEKLRLSSLTVNMRGVQFNAPSEWESGNVECKDAISVLATATMLESDINKSIENRTFGKGQEHWHDMSMKITPKGLSGKGYYKHSFLDILLEIDSKLKIVKNKELWL